MEYHQTGAAPNKTPVTSETRNVNPSTGSEGLAWIGMWRDSGNASANIMCDKP